WSPKYATDLPSAVFPITIALRTPASAWKFQWMHPVLASSAKISPSAVPTYRRPPTTTGCVPPDVAPGYPNAHFSFNRGASSAVKPADVPELKRVFVMLAPQLFHSGAVCVLLN